MKTFAQDPTAQDFVQDPYPFYDRTRAAGPMFFWAEYDMPCVTGYGEVDALLRDRRLGREFPVEFQKPYPAHIETFAAFERRSMLEMEPPAHTRLRGLVMRAFTSRRIASMEGEIAALANQLIDEFPAHTFDLLAAFAEKIPVIIIARLLGVPDEMAPQLLRWSHDMVAMYQANRTRQTEDAAVVATDAFSAYMRGYVDERRKSPSDDLITTLIAAEEDGSKLSNDELIATSILLLNAGHEATVHAIGNGVNLLLAAKTTAKELTAPDRIDATIEEILRFDPPLHMFTRIAYEDLDLCGHPIKRGTEIGLLLAAANRDPAKFATPNTFRPSRTDQAHTSFGAGVHFCIGAPLARLEMKTALPILFARHPNLKLSQPVEFADRYHFHGLADLMVKL